MNDEEIMAEIIRLDDWISANEPPYEHGYEAARRRLRWDDECEYGPRISRLHDGSPTDRKRVSRAIRRLSDDGRIDVTAGDSGRALNVRAIV